MAKFEFRFEGGLDPDATDQGFGTFYGNKNGSAFLGVDDLLEVLRPAALKLRDYYREALSTIVHRRSGELADSIEIEDDAYIRTGEVSIRIAPYGKHGKSKRKRKSRKGSSDAKYAKHNRNPKANALSNQELAYYLEYGTPRIAARHWQETTNEAVADEIQSMIEAEFDELLKRKGLL